MDTCFRQKGSVMSFTCGSMTVDTINRSYWRHFNRFLNDKEQAFSKLLITFPFLGSDSWFFLTLIVGVLSKRKTNFLLPLPGIKPGWPASRGFAFPLSHIAVDCKQQVLFCTNLLSRDKSDTIEINTGSFCWENVFGPPQKLWLWTEKTWRH